MKTFNRIYFSIIYIIISTNCSSQTIQTDYIQAFLDTLTAVEDRSPDVFFKSHCNSIREVISAKQKLTAEDNAFIKIMYDKFNNTSDAYNAKIFSSYKARMKSMIMSWVSPTDGAVSFSWLKLPKDWDPEKEYPLYIHLHGKWFVADNPIEYLAYPYQYDSGYQFAFEDGYLLSPWGRGNLWYEGISETDIWECINTFDKALKINHTRMYVTGHSMGGYGSWYLAQKAPEYWAACAVYAGAIWYQDSKLVNTDVAQTLKNMPVYFVCGDQDGNLSIDQTAYNLLLEAGNENAKFVTFHGGHEFLEENVYQMYLWIRQFSRDNWNYLEATEQQSGLLSVFPNPVKGTCSISVKLPQLTSAILSVIDLKGRTVKNITQVKSGIYNFDISNYAEGVYILKLNSSSVLSVAKMIVVK